MDNKKLDALFEKMIDTNQFNMDSNDLSHIEDLDSNFIEKLANIQSEKDWEALRMNSGDARDALLSFKERTDKSWISIDSKGCPIGLFGINTIDIDDADERFQDVIFDYIDGGTIIEDIYLLAFKKNTVTLVKDVLQKIQELKEEYPFICWSVDNDNDIAYSIYNRWVPRQNGIILEELYENHTGYIISNFFKKQKNYNIREQLRLAEKIINDAYIPIRSRLWQ